MQCLVFVKFLPGGSLPPEEFFARINARWSQLDGSEDAGPEKTISPPSRSGVCIADYDSIEQLTMDLAVMPGAGIANIEVVPISGETELEHIATDVSLKMSQWEQEPV
jgi:hypothetical protein